MTNDEAIYTLKNTAFLGWSEQAEKVSEAVRMAVEALKAQLSKEDITSDCISRQAVIDTLCDWICGVGERCVKTHCQCIRRIEAIPSVQPDIIACGDCKHWIYHDRRCGYWNHGVKPLEWCCHAERRTNETD